MNDWMILGIEKTDDLRKVKHAYAEKTKLYHPETHPEEFQKLHNAYKRIVAEIRRNADPSQQLQVQVPNIVPVPEKQVVVIPKSERDIKQDENFLKLVEDAAEHFEERHTDKRDPAQVARVEYILQHDVRNSKLLEQFQRLLHNEFFAEGWREFFINEEFLERQYEPEFINGMTEIIKSRVMVYYIIVYGDIFEGIEHVQFDKKIYKKELLQGMANMFLLNEDKRDAYMLVEQREELLGERYVFSLYRRILKELDADRPAKDKILEVIQEGFQKEGISKVFFDLLFYLMTSNRKNIPVFRVALAQACQMEWDNSIQDEVEILKLELGELPVKENITEEKPMTETPTIKVQTVDVRTKGTRTKGTLTRGIGLYAFIVAVLLICTIVMGNFAYKEVCDAQMLGTVSLRPVKFKEEWERRKEGDTTYVTGRTYYIIYEYQWEGSIETVSLRCDEVYSQDNRETAKAAIKNQEIIERKIYLDNLGKRHFSKCETEREFKIKHVKDAIMFCIIMTVFVLFPGVLWLIIHLMKKKEIYFIQKQRPDAVICTGATFIVCYFVEIGFIFIVMGVCMVASCEGGAWDMAVSGFFIMLMGLALTIMLFLHIWNRRVVLDKEEVLFKNVFGKEMRYSKSEITQCKTLNYTVYRGGMGMSRRFFYINVGKEKIAINNCMSNYYEAIEFANRNYM